MHKQYYGNKTIVDFDLTKALKSKEEAPQFDAVPVPEFDDVDEAMAELNEAEQTLFKYKQMHEHIKRADEITDSITCGNVQFDHMTEYDEVPTLEHCTMDVLSMARANIESQILKFQQYVSDLEAEIEAIQEQDSDDEKYGTYDEQVRGLFYSTR